MKDSMSDAYPGMSEDEASPSMEGEHDESMPHKDKDEESETALIPRSLFGGHDPKAGEEYVFEVVRAYEGDEIEIKYAPKKKGEEGDEEDSAHSKLDAMGTEMGEGNPGSMGGY